MPRVRAILVSDLHLQQRPPLARSCEPDWFDAMARPLAEIRGLLRKHKAPVIYAGDIFDRWNAGPEVINFALRRLPRGFAVPGQHDLPNHDYDQMERSAYGTLVAADHLVNLPPGEPYEVAPGLTVTGFPWGVDPHPHERPKGCTDITVAVIHRFIWTKGTGYPGAPEEAHLKAIRRKLKGYDVAVFGDNHKGFLVPDGPTKIINCGGMMQRKTDEADYRPGCGLLHYDGTITRHYFNTTRDVIIEYTEGESAVERLLDMSAFVGHLRELGEDDELDFRAAVTRFFAENDIDEQVKTIIREALDGPQ